MLEKITLAELRRELEGGDVTVVEALGPQYYEDGHIPGAINIQHTEVDELAPSLLPDRDAAIVVYCASGPCRNSSLAAQRLVRVPFQVGSSVVMRFATTPERLSGRFLGFRCQARFLTGTGP